MDVSTTARSAGTGNLIGNDGGSSADGRPYRLNTRCAGAHGRGECGGSLLGGHLHATAHGCTASQLNGPSESSSGSGTARIVQFALRFVAPGVADGSYLPVTFRATQDHVLKSSIRRDNEFIPASGDATANWKVRLDGPNAAFELAGSAGRSASGSSYLNGTSNPLEETFLARVGYLYYVTGHVQALASGSTAYQASSDNGASAAIAWTFTSAVGGFQTPGGTPTSGSPGDAIAPPNPVPEPASLATLGLGLAAFRRRRRS